MKYRKGEELEHKNKEEYREEDKGRKGEALECKKKEDDWRRWGKI